MADSRVVTDAAAADLIDTYEAGIRRLERLIRRGLERGLDAERLASGEQQIGDATLAYRERQLRAARILLRRLRRQAGGSRAAVERAYRAAIKAVDAVVLELRSAEAARAYEAWQAQEVFIGEREAIGGRGLRSTMYDKARRLKAEFEALDAASKRSAELATRFGGVHERAVERLAGNLERSLTKAADAAGTNVATVFDRASALEGAIPAGGVDGVGFVGRRVDDPWRRIALEELGRGVVALDTRRQVSANLVARLVDEGVADAVTGFVDSAGRRWSLERYAAMVARTTTREATSRGTVNRMGEHGLDLVEVSSHANPCPICEEFDGNTYSLSGDSPGYDTLDELAPWHPGCIHVLTPAGADLGEFERELAGAV